MSKRDLRSAGSFAGAPQGVSARRRAVAASLGGDEDLVRTPTSIRPDQAAVNPANPRDDIDADALAELAASMREVGQVQPVTVMTRGAYLAVLPEHEESIGAAEYVVISGSRRLMAARKAELDSLLIHVNTTLKTREAVLEFALVENIQRADISPLAEARAVQALCGIHGNQHGVGKRLGKSQGWVSQRLALLKLAPELQEKLRQGELKVKDARTLGTLPQEEQQAEWERRKEEKTKEPDPEPSPGASTEQDPEPEPVPEPAPAPDGVNPVYAEGQGEGQPQPSAGGGEASSAGSASGSSSQVAGSRDAEKSASSSSASGGEQSVQLMLDLEWEPTAAASEVVRAYGSARAKEMAEAILAQV